MTDDSNSFKSISFEYNNYDKYQRIFSQPMNDSFIDESFEFSISELTLKLISSKSTNRKSDEEAKKIEKSDKTLLNKKRKKPHDKFDKDNIKRFTQVSYFTFLVDFINLIIRTLFIKENGFDSDFQNKEINDKYQFKSIKYELKKDITNEAFNKLKSKNLKEIFTKNTSNRNKYYKNDAVYGNVLKINNKIEKILEQKYLEFFPIFYRNNNFINLIKYELNIDISLENIKRYEFFKTKALKNISEPEEQVRYIQRLEESIRDNFMKKTFVVKKEKFNYIIYSKFIFYFFCLVYKYL